ncbi:hypothetical protein G6F50_018707 [Rhizopus delemar]|uniref:Uncharacterized protein n=1 Tax=Rhizopus delemar TaxID=936053 RepID=A0A9P7BYU9_9FUNG|nr:hypothetical protein G6F50_018707 [Rhizopus delemar]
MQRAGTGPVATVPQQQHRHAGQACKSERRRHCITGGHVIHGQQRKDPGPAPQLAPRHAARSSAIHVQPVPHARQGQ